MTKTLENFLKRNDIKYKYGESMHDGEYYYYKVYESPVVTYKVDFDEGISAEIKPDSELGKSFFLSEKNSLHKFLFDCFFPEIQ